MEINAATTVLQVSKSQNIKLYQHRPQIAKTNFCEQCNVCKKLKTKFIAVFLGVWVKLVALKIGTYETEIGTQQWHHVNSPKVGRHPPTIAHYNGTQQWHHVHSPKVGRHPPPHHTTQQWQWHPAKAPRPLLQSWSAHYNGTQKWHHVHCTLQWHPGATSNPPKWVVALPPIGTKNPYSYRYLGKYTLGTTLLYHTFLRSPTRGPGGCGYQSFLVWESRSFAQKRNFIFEKPMFDSCDL